MLSNQFKNNTFLQEYQSIINDINLLEDKVKILTDSDLRIESFKLQKEYQEHNNLDLLIKKSFALTREASKRTLGLRHFDVQLMGGLVLNENKIAEMKTGEGKTLVATLSASLNALTKKGVHIITVNDYLANRDQVGMNPIYHFLGFDAGLIQEKMTKKDRQANYSRDITYVTNSELTFDYLRDNTVLIPTNTVLRPFNYCIIDEIDSILIDEAQMPIILAASITNASNDKYIVAAEVINYLTLNIDYTIDEKNKNVAFTEAGYQQLEKILQTENLYNFSNPWIPYLLNALKAANLYLQNVHYIVQNDRIVIIDEFTGRIMLGRRWSEGLHQAIEAKEKVTIRPRTETQATITYQNFFLMYPKLSGMTGTAKTSELEFLEIYNLPVTTIPTFKPIKRNDLPDMIYKNQFAKWDAIARFCNTISSTGQPVLIGTATIEKSDMLAQLLNEYKLSYQILNAKPENVRKESQIVAQAGKKNTITIATNMAGRGTDIILGGNVNFKAQKDLYNLIILIKNSIGNIEDGNSRRFKKYLISYLRIFEVFRKTLGCSQKFYSVLLNLFLYSDFRKLSNINILKLIQENDRIATFKIFYQFSIKFLLDELLSHHKKHQRQENQIVKNLGGLYVIGTERSESRRVDNQLIGRCGRQGDPGVSQFFLSLDDKLLRLFGGNQLENFVSTILIDDSSISSDLVSKSLASAQQRIEERLYQVRKSLFDYDNVLNKQRNLIYFERQLILENSLSNPNILGFGEQNIMKIFLNDSLEKDNLTKTINRYTNLIGRNQEIRNIKNFTQKCKGYDFFELKNFYFRQFWLDYQIKHQESIIYGNKFFNLTEKKISLDYLDKIWKDHINKLALLRDAVKWRGYGQRNPVIEYKKEAYGIFAGRQETYTYSLLYEIFRIGFY